MTTFDWFMIGVGVGSWFAVLVYWLQCKKLERCANNESVEFIRGRPYRIVPEHRMVMLEILERHNQHEAARLTRDLELDKVLEDDE